MTEKNFDIFIPARIDSSRLPQKHLLTINKTPLLKILVNRLRNSKKIRKSFGKIPLVTSLPNLIEVQKRSFDSFLQLKIDPEKRENIGLHSIFKSVLPNAKFIIPSDRIDIDQHQILQANDQGIFFVPFYEPFYLFLHLGGVVYPF